MSINVRVYNEVRRLNATELWAVKVGLRSILPGFELSNGILYRVAT